MTDVAARPLSAEDQLAIAAVVAKFAHRSDYCDWEGLATLFTDDVVTEMDGLPIRYVGIEGQIEHARASAEQAGGKNRHYYTNLYIEQEDDEVVAHYMLVNANAGTVPLGIKIITTGRMRDTMVRTADGWKIARRRCALDQDVELNF